MRYLTFFEYLEFSKSNAMIATRPTQCSYMSKFAAALNAIDPLYLSTQMECTSIVSDPVLDQELAAAVRHSSVNHSFELKKMMRHKVPLLFVVEFLGAPDKSTTLPTRSEIAQRWLTPRSGRLNYHMAIKDRLFYALLLIFSLSVISAVVFSVLVHALFGMWSVIGLLTVSVFTLIADVGSWWQLRGSVANLNAVAALGNPLAEKVRGHIAVQKDPRTVLSRIEPSQAHLLTHWSNFELRAILSTTGAVRKQLLSSVPPTFNQTQRRWATHGSYPGYLIHMVWEMFPVAWKKEVKALHRRLQ